MVSEETEEAKSVFAEGVQETVWCSVPGQLEHWPVGPSMAPTCCL